MQQKVKKDILNILNKSLKLIKENNIVKLKELSNHTIHDASIYQDEYSTSIAVVIYSLAKIFERPRYKKYKSWPLFHKTTINTIKSSLKYLKKDQIQEYTSSLQELLTTINKLEPKFRKYIQEVIEKAKIQKASRLHEHGISIKRTADILGITEWELMEYTGKTGIADVKQSITKDIEERIIFTRSLFK